MKSVVLSIYYILFLFLNVFAQHSVKDDSSPTSDAEKITDLLKIYKTFLRHKPNEAELYLCKTLTI